MSAKEQSVTCRAKKERVHIQLNSPIHRHSATPPTEEIAHLSSPGSSSGVTLPPSTLSSEGCQDELVEDELADHELSLIPLILVWMGYLLGIFGLVIYFSYLFIGSIDLTPEFPFMCSCLFTCCLVSHWVPRGSRSRVSAYAVQKRRPYTDMEDDDVNDYPLGMCATGASSEESIQILLGYGMTLHDLLAAGKTVLDLYIAGIPVRTMYEAEITVRDMCDAGVPVKMIYNAGIPVKMIYDAGVPVEIMLDAGISSKVLIQGGVPVEGSSATSSATVTTSAEVSLRPPSRRNSLQEPHFKFPM